MKFTKLGMSTEEMERSLKLGLRYDKRTRKNLISEYETPSACTEEDIKTLEKIIPGNLPNDYRQFILSHNGGIPEKCLFPIGNNSNRVVNELFPAKFRDTTYELSYNLTTIFTDRIPKQCLPIGRDPGGNLFILCLDQSRGYGSIYFWNHEAETEPATYSNMTKLSDSFSEFLDKLTEDLIDD